MDGENKNHTRRRGGLTPAGAWLLPALSDLGLDFFGLYQIHRDCVKTRSALQGWPALVSVSY
jgi:hypothetical protein